jgi:hypothetical protein
MFNMPSKFEATTPCTCGVIMRLTMVEPLPLEPNKMQHSFICPMCGTFKQFKYLKGIFPK